MLNNTSLVISKPFLTYLVDFHDVRRFAVVTAVGMHRPTGKIKWLTVVFQFDSDGVVDYSRPLATSWSNNRDEALENHLRCISRYSVA